MDFVPAEATPTSPLTHNVTMRSERFLLRHFSIPMAALFGIYVLSFVGWPRLSMDPEVVHMWLAVAVGVSAAAAMLARARLLQLDRWVWVLVATSVAVQSLSELAWRLLDVGTPSILDAFWLFADVLLAAAFILLARGRAPRLRLFLVLDSCLAALGIAAAAILWVYPSLSSTPDTLESAVNLAYPLFDLLFILILLVVAASLQWRLGWTFLLIALAMIIQVSANAAYFVVGVGDGAGAGGSRGLIDILWSLAYVTLACAAVVDKTDERTSYRSREATGLAAGALVTSIVVLALQPFRAVPLPAAMLATSALLIGSVRLLTSIRQLHQFIEAHQQARTDDLTSLANRRHLHERLVALTSNPSTAPVSLILLDLDRFKLINDTLGHDVGDELLRHVGRCLVGEVGDGVAARLGGDEFAIVLQGLDSSRTLAVAHRVHRAIAADYRTGSINIRVDASVGVAVWPDDGADVDDLLRAADQAMYEAKRRRNGVQAYEPSFSRDAETTFDIVQTVRQGLQADHLQVLFQPIVHIRSRDIVSVEALARWTTSTGMVLAPPQFLPTIQELGAMSALTDIVLDRALAEVLSWHRHGKHLSASVNVAAADVQDRAFASRIKDALKRHGLPGSSLTLELTENAVLDQLETAGSALAELRKCGVRLVLDDFGTGQASLANLRLIPIDGLKIDKSFVQDLPGGAASEAVVRAIVELGRSLDVTVVAEGIETAATLAKVVELGCHLGQGFFWCAPVPAAAITNFGAPGTSILAGVRTTA